MVIDFERRCWAEIDLDGLHHNLQLIRKTVQGCAVMAVVKANAYGHGDLVTAKALDDAGADQFAVSGLAEAVRLRRAGIRKPILILGYTSPKHVSTLATHDLQQCIFSSSYAEEMSHAAQKAGTVLRVHLKVDTGMGRLGFNAKDDLAEAVAGLAIASRLPGLLPEGLFTHFSVADSTEEEDVKYTNNQLALFIKVKNALESMGISFSTVHCCNSAGTVAYPAAHMGLVRPGIILYGCNPSGEVVLAGLKPAFKLKTVVTMVKELAAGDSVSYGRTFTARRPMRVATLAAGYADGYPRLLSNQGVVGIHGHSAPLLGRVCMDQIVVDVTDVPEVQGGDEATVFGGDGADTIEEVAEKCGTISYEILCNIGRRVQRLYKENGEETMIANYIED